MRKNESEFLEFFRNKLTELGWSVMSNPNSGIFRKNGCLLIFCYGENRDQQRHEFNPTSDIKFCNPTRPLVDLNVGQTWYLEHNGLILDFDKLPLSCGKLLYEKGTDRQLALVANFINRVETLAAMSDLQQLCVAKQEVDTIQSVQKKVFADSTDPISLNSFFRVKSYIEDLSLNSVYKVVNVSQAEGIAVLPVDETTLTFRTTTPNIIPFEPFISYIQDKSVIAQHAIDIASSAHVMQWQDSVYTNTVHPLLQELPTNHLNLHQKRCLNEALHNQLNFTYILQGTTRGESEIELLKCLTDGFDIKQVADKSAEYIAFYRAIRKEFKYVESLFNLDLQLDELRSAYDERFMASIQQVNLAPISNKDIALQTYLASMLMQGKTLDNYENYTATVLHAMLHTNELDNVDVKLSQTLIQYGLKGDDYLYTPWAYLDEAAKLEVYDKFDLVLSDPEQVKVGELTYHEFFVKFFEQAYSVGFYPYRGFGLWSNNYVIFKDANSIGIYDSHMQCQWRVVLINGTFYTNHEKEKGISCINSFIG